MSNKKQTAVEWFIELFKDEPRFLNEFALEIKHAKELEKQQIEDAHLNGQSEFDTGRYRYEVVTNAEQYYKETYE